MGFFGSFWGKISEFGFLNIAIIQGLLYVWVICIYHFSMVTLLLREDENEITFWTFVDTFGTWYTPARTLSISGIKSGVLKLSFLSLNMMVKSGLESILKLTKPLHLLSCQANSAILGRYFCTGQQQLWRGSVNIKIKTKNSRPLFTIIF